MIKVYAKTVSGEQICLGPPLSLVINREIGIAADSAVCTLPLELETKAQANSFESALPDIKELSIARGEKEIFCGIVDTCSENISKSGSFIEISARSLAALLLDNQAKPGTYYRPTAEVIFDNFLNGYGVDKYTSSKITANNILTVYKGASRYAVLEEFCKRFLNTVPYIDSGCVHFDGPPKGKALAFGSGGVPYLSKTVEKSRLGRISKIRVKAGENSEYGLVFSDKEAIENGIVRERYVNSADKISSASPETARRAIENAKSQDIFASVSILGCVTDCLGQDASVDKLSGLYIYKMRYTLSKSGEKTALYFKRRQENVAE